MPLSPVSSTVDAGLVATLRTRCRSAASHRTRRRSGSGCTAARAFAQLPHLAPRAASSRARARRSHITSSRLNGLLAKWYAPIFIASTAVSTLA